MILPVGANRGAADRPLGEELPLLLAGLRGEGRHRAVVRRGNEERLACHHGLIGGVEVEPLLAFERPHLLRWRKQTRPEQDRFRLHPVRSRRTPFRIIPPRRPVPAEGA